MDRNFINSLARGFRLLEVFSPAQPFRGITEMSKKLGISKTSVFRIAYSLTKLGYLNYDSENQKYSIGPRVLAMGFATIASMRIVEVARPHMAELSRATGESVNLAILDGHEVIYVGQIKTNRILETKLFPGSRVSIYNTSIGRAILAYQPLEKLNEILRKLIEIPEARPFLGEKNKKILKTLKKVRIKRYATNNEEWEVGIRAIGAPIFNREGLVEGAINVSALSSKISIAELEYRWASLLVETAKKISFFLGFHLKE